MGVWVCVVVALFVLGSLMALMPSARARQLDALRMTARRIGLQPKLVACPDWLVGRLDKQPNQPLDNPLDNMVAQYGCIVEGARLPACDFLAVDGRWQLAAHWQAFAQTEPSMTNKFLLNNALNGASIDLPTNIAQHALGLSVQANFIALYWRENLDASPATLETRTNDLIQLKTDLQRYADLLHNGAI